MYSTRSQRNSERARAGGGAARYVVRDAPACGTRDDACRSRRDVPERRRFHLTSCGRNLLLLLSHQKGEHIICGTPCLSLGPSVSPTAHWPSAGAPVPHACGLCAPRSQSQSGPATVARGRRNLTGGLKLHCSLCRTPLSTVLSVLTQSFPRVTARLRPRARAYERAARGPTRTRTVHSHAKYRF